MNLRLHLSSRLTPFDQMGLSAPTTRFPVTPLHYCTLSRTSLWPDGYIPPAVLERREEAERVKRKHEQARVREKNAEATPSKKDPKENEDVDARDSAVKAKLAADICKNTSGGRSAGKKRKTGGKKNKKGVEKGEGGAGTNNVKEKMEQEKQKEEEKLRQASALQKKEELARKRAARKALGKGIGRSKKVSEDRFKTCRRFVNVSSIVEGSYLHRSY